MKVETTPEGERATDELRAVISGVTVAVNGDRIGATLPARQRTRSNVPRGPSAPAMTLPEKSEAAVVAKTGSWVVLATLLSAPSAVTRRAVMSTMAAPPPGRNDMWKMSWYSP